MLIDRFGATLGLYALAIVFLAFGVLASTVIGVAGGAQVGVLAFLFVLATGFLIAAVAMLVTMTVLDVRRSAA